MPRLKLRAKRSTPEPEQVHTPTRCCVVCYNDFTPFSFDSEKWSSNMIKNFYIALNIPWSGSEDEDGEDEEVIYLPFCPQCHTKVSVMQSYQIELQNLQSKFNAVRNDVAFAVVQSIGKHSKDGPIVQIRQQIFEKWKLTFEEKQKTENIADEVGLEYIAHEPSSRPHICGVHFCNCQRSQASDKAGTKAKEEVDEANLQSSAFVEDRPPNLGNGSFFGNGNRKPQPQARRISSLNGSMPVLSKMVRSSTGNATKYQAGAQRHSTPTSHVPSLIPFQGSFAPREMKVFECKVPPLRKISNPASNLNLSTTGGNKVFGRQRLQPPLLTYVGHKGSPQRAGSLKFPASISKLAALGSGHMLGAGVKATVPSHIVAKTPNRVIRRAGMRTGTGSPAARQRIQMQGTPSRNVYRSRFSAGMKEAPASMIVEPEIGSLEALSQYGKRSSTEDFKFAEPPAKLAKRSGSISPSKRGSGRNQPLNTNVEPESLDSNEDEPIPRTRGSPRSPYKSPIESLSSLAQAESGVFACQWCEKFYSSLSRLRRHGSFEHPDKLKIQCEYENCTKGFSNEVAYKRHVQHQHKISLDGLKTMTCPRCRKCFVKASSFRTHLKSHGMTLSEIVEVLDAAENEEDEHEQEHIDDITTVTASEDTLVNSEEIEGAVVGEKAEAQEPIIKVKRKQTIQRPFGIRKRKRRARNSIPKVEITSPPSRRRRSQKPQGPLDPVRKSSRQRGVQIDAGLPMYPAPKPRSRNKGATESGNQDESDGIPPATVDSQETNPEKAKDSTDPIIPGSNDAGEKEPVGSETVQASTAHSSDSVATGLQKDVEQVIQQSEIQEEPSAELSLDDSFVRGAKSETSISSSPIRMEMNSETVFTSTPMVCRVESEKYDLDIRIETNHAPQDEEGTTMSTKGDSEEPNADDSDKSSTAMNTTYTLDPVEDDTGDGDSGKQEITQVEDKQ